MLSSATLPPAPINLRIGSIVAQTNNNWARAFYGSLGTENDIGQAVAVDRQGNVVVAGKFQGTVDFGGGPLTSAGQFDIFLAKFSASGTHLWSKRFGNGNGDWNGDRANCVAVDSSDNIIVGGGFQGNVDFGGGQVVGRGISDIFVAKYSPAGSHLWSKGFGNTQNDQAAGLVADASGNVIVTGDFAGTVDFGGGPRTSFGNDTFLAKFTPVGGHLWSTNFPSNSADFGRCVAVDSIGNVVVGITFLNGIQIGTNVLIAAGSGGYNAVDIAVAKLDAAGRVLWAKRFGGLLEDEPSGLGFDSSGNIFVGGYFSGTVDFGGGSFTSRAYSDMFLLKLSQTGSHIWSRQFGGTDLNQCRGVSVDPQGNAWATGAFAGAGEFGLIKFNAFGQADVFVAKYSTIGNAIWAQHYGGTSQDVSNAIAVDGSGSVSLTGNFNGTATFGTDTFTGKSLFNIFVFRFVP